MRITYQLVLVPLTLISSLAFLVHGMPHQESAVDASTLSGRDDTANYVVYPKDATDQDQAKAIQTLLESVVSDPTKIYVSSSLSSSDHSTLSWFWGIPLTSENAQKVGADSNVAAIVQQCTSNCADPLNDDQPSSKSKRSNDGAKYEERSRVVKRDGQPVNAHNVETEVAFISWPDETTLGTDFVYDNTAGAEVTVYIVDSGAGLANNDEFSRYVIANKRYLQAQGAEPNDGLENDVEVHGTGMLAKVAGWKHGVAKRSKPVIVRVQDKGDPGAWLDGVKKVYDDWLPTYEANRNTATAVINLSWGWTREALGQSNYQGFIGDVWIGQLELLLQQCIGIGLLPIAASGNAPFNQPVNQYPQLFAYNNGGSPPTVPNMMVVGGVTVDGNRWDRSRVDVPGNPQVIKLHAPSFHINVPAPDGGWRNPNVVQGVSYAGATISGLATYFLGLSSLSDVIITDDPVQRVKNLKEQLEVDSAVARVPNINSVWNLVNPRTCPPGTPPPGFQDGDEVPCADTSTTSGNTVIAIPYCFITTVAPIPSMGLNSPSTECSCADGAIAGIGSGTVSGTTYSWCETGGLPSGVPTEVTAPASGLASPPARSTGPTQTCSIRDEVGGRGVIGGHQCICNIGPTPKPTIVNKEFTCPTIPPSKKRGLLGFSNQSW